MVKGIPHPQIKSFKKELLFLDETLNLPEDDRVQPEPVSHFWPNRGSRRWRLWERRLGRRTVWETGVQVTTHTLPLGKELLRPP